MKLDIRSLLIGVLFGVILVFLGLMLNPRQNQNSDNYYFEKEISKNAMMFYRYNLKNGDIMMYRLELNENEDRTGKWYKVPPDSSYMYLK